ncbi:MAG: hypothetical protein CMO80_16965 [Verrucomicrobiales bacterium]|nr:hypothetical protein [Verrucomicrobiales bacterium]
MSTQVKVRRQGDRINDSLQLGFAPGQSMMECEEQIQQAINSSGPKSLNTAFEVQLTRPCADGIP